MATYPQPDRKEADAMNSHAESASGFPAGAMEERHFSPEQLGELWNLSPDTTRRLFEHEPGVLVIERKRSHARRYRTLRIPESVAARVHRRLANPVDVHSR